MLVQGQRLAQAAHKAPLSLGLESRPADLLSMACLLACVLVDLAKGSLPEQGPFDVPIHVCCWGLEPLIKAPIASHRRKW